MDMYWRSILFVYLIGDTFIIYNIYKIFFMEKKSYDQNTVGESRWTLLSCRYKMDFVLFIFLWICFISNLLLFFFISVG